MQHQSFQITFLANIYEKVAVLLLKSKVEWFSKNKSANNRKHGNKQKNGVIRRKDPDLRFLYYWYEAEILKVNNIKSQK